MFDTKKKGFGFGAMPGFNGRKQGTISNGDYDRDGVKNKKDCKPFNFKKQDKCPRCGESYEKGMGALSRRDNSTKLCPQCGTDEAMIDFANSHRSSR